jgi:hypothetical protein
MDSIDKEDTYSSVKKYLNNEENSMSGNLEFEDSTKARKARIRKLVDGISRIDELERVLVELEDTMQHLEPQLLVDLTGKLNIGREITAEVTELIQ